MMKFSRFIALLTISIIAAGCAQEVDEPLPEPQPARKAISCGISGVAGLSTRTLVTNANLQTLCAAGTGTESIGLWGVFVNAGTRTKIFNAEPLTYGAKAQDTNPYNQWNYPSETRYWNSGMLYDFRACFPQDLMTNLMEQMDATNFQGPINTKNTQDDILVGATRVNTQTSPLPDVVDIELQHIFAAIRFQVKAADGYTPSADEGVVACWLQNQGTTDDLFSRAGYLLHTGNETPEIHWTPYSSVFEELYRWEYPTGVNFDDDEPHSLYVPNGTNVGELYTRNDSWIMVIPQTVKAGSLKFFYKMKHTADKVFSVTIPAITYQPGVQYNYILEIRGASATISLTIQDWNKLDASYDVEL